MAVYKTISSKTIIRKIFRDLRPDTNNWIDDAIEWVGEALEHIGAASQLCTKQVVLDIKDHKTLMPSDLYYINQVSVNIRGVFEDPQDVSVFDECDGIDGCYDDAIHQFPISLDILSLINQGLMAGELALLAGTLSDTENDRMQDVKSSGAAQPK